MNLWGPFALVSVLYIGLFDGLGGLRPALEKLGASVAGYIICENPKAAKRLVRLRWPGVIEWGDITKLTYEVVKSPLEAFAGLISLVVLAAGSPCQDLSGANIRGTGLRGSRGSFVLFDSTCGSLGQYIV